MMFNKILKLVVCVGVTVIALNGCTKSQEGKTSKHEEKTISKQEGQQLVLKDYGPTDIKAGKDFNLQKGGYSAIWIHGDNLTPNTIIVVNGAKLKGNKHKDDPTLLSTEIPKELYKSSGEYPIYLLDTQAGAKSNELKFVVK